MGPISYISPKTSRAARDRPELNLEGISRHDIAGASPGGDRHHENFTRREATHGRDKRGAPMRHLSRGNRHFTVGGGRLRQSGPRPEGILLRQPALEGLTRSAWMDSPRQIGRNKFRRSEAPAPAPAAFEERMEAAT
ncbi:hypothetical protein F511_18862 [Dorcoceras hygrometricum]|uniref:Uncharacterized protein n=1 Tax=Dorcoceras hygrometricum TaxID=472368 RepID=A0A2Z7A6Q1_9LAMI|nr:hypothetical protein F511_18862 [Dorcoceras hygrometricum]